LSLVALAEGLPISQMTEPQREQVWSILRAFNCYLPAKALEARMNRLKSVQEETYFAWIGGYGLGDPYYFRIHSPMTFSEVSAGISGSDLLLEADSVSVASSVTDLIVRLPLRK
jgi:hypothetical protein